MRRLNRYILKQLVGPFTFFALTLTGVLWLTQSLRTVDWIINKGLSVGYFIYLTSLAMPTVLALVLPIALFAAVLYTYHRLSIDRELVVMWSSGVTTMRMARPALLLALAVTLATYAMTLYFMPAGQRELRELKTAMRTDLSFVLLQEGMFNTIGTHLTVYIRARRPNGEMLGILVHDSRDPDRPVTMMAERGALVITPEGPRFVMENGNRQEIDHAAGRLSTLHFDSYVLDLSQFIEKNQEPWLEAGERYLGELFNPGTSPDDLKNARHFLAEAHDRLVSPLYSIAFAMIALATMLSGQFSRRGYGWRVSAGLGAGVLSRLVGVGLTNLAAKLPALIPLMYLNVVLAIGVSVYLLARRPRLAPPRMPEPAR